MATVTTESVESKTRVTLGYEVFDLFFIFFYIGGAYFLRGLVNPRLHALYFVFSFIVAGFLTSKSSLNKKRRNFESLYFLLTKDLCTFRPVIASEDDYE